MATSGDVTIQDGGHLKLHPYLVALVRWCVSCLRSTVTILLHRLLTAPLTPIAGSKPSKSRPAGKDHLHPEPRVECVVLHHPSVHSLDVIFVHGLYGSLGNTWRQGEWKPKYTRDPDKIHLRKPTSTQILNHCHKCTDIHSNKEDFGSFKNDSVNNSYKNINSDAFTKNFLGIDKILPKDDVFITEKFYNNTLLNQVEIVGNYETQAKFVSDLFKNNCDTNCDTRDENNDIFDNDGNLYNNDQNIFNNAENIYNNGQNVTSNENVCKCNNDVNEGCKCKVNEGKQCEVGCGCICDECYSPCWPKDWIKIDYPEARVISINYTSDPHLWRPLWVKENKRLRLHERADQMTTQLLDLGVGERPVIWVGHSKGGLFIKQIYCEAYEAYLKTKNQDCANEKDKQSMTEFNNDNEINNINDIFDNTNDAVVTENLNNNDRNGNNGDRNGNNSDINGNNSDNNGNNGNNSDKNGNNSVRNINNNDESIENTKLTSELDNRDSNVLIATEDTINNDGNKNNSDRNSNNNAETSEIIGENRIIRQDLKETLTVLEEEQSILENEYRTEEFKSLNNEDNLRSQAGLWTNSSGFMFYSVPHRGSPLADIKAPLTARSVELMEITKDCPLVLTLQERWLRACSPSQPLVRSLVETRRTLMSVLWLRIVSAESADPGIGALCGISVDHREICKPSSRHCLLYTELTNVIEAALSKCRCH